MSRFRMREISLSFLPASSAPRTRTLPASGRSRPPRQCNSVLFPDPEGPTMTTIFSRGHGKVHAAQYVEPAPAGGEAANETRS